jgi:hypothetical protein
MPQIVDVLWVGPNRAAIKAVNLSGYCYQMVDRAEGERVQAALAEELRDLKT